jgi:hypothetical protein
MFLLSRNVGLHGEFVPFPACPSSWQRWPHPPHRTRGQSKAISMRLVHRRGTHGGQYWPTLPTPGKTEEEHGGDQDPSLRRLAIRFCRAASCFQPFVSTPIVYTGHIQQADLVTQKALYSTGSEVEIASLPRGASVREESSAFRESSQSFERSDVTSVAARDFQAVPEIRIA